MTQAPAHDVPRWVPALLSFAAGYVDSYTFLALFGLFVAQVTGSFVTAGAQFVVYDIGFAGKMIAIFAFLLAAASTAALIGLARDKGRDALFLDAGAGDALPRGLLLSHARRTAGGRA